MFKLLQVNIVSNMFSTGRICEDIAKVLIANGWDSYIAYGRWANPSVSHDLRIGTNFDMYEHYAEHRLFDNEGFASRRATRKLIKWIEQLRPDIIQLHNIHDHYLSYPILFKYFAEIDTPIVWVQHDCWAFTGGCVYPDLFGCEKWKTDSCKGSCMNKRAILCNKSQKQYKLKQELLSKIKNLTYVSVSEWLGCQLKESFNKDRRIFVIHNGVDLGKFAPLKREERKAMFVKENSPKHFSILGVASVWDQRKGLQDFIKLRSILPAEYDITLVGLTPKQIKSLPMGIKGITRTSNVNEMVQLYSVSDVFVNPTYSDNFPTTNIEALACGTPVITYQTGGSPEAIDEKTGTVVAQGDIEALVDAIKKIETLPFSSVDCRKRAEEYFDKDKQFKKYMNLYEELLNK